MTRNEFAIRFDDIVSRFNSGAIGIYRTVQEIGALIAKHKESKKHD